MKLHTMSGCVRVLLRLPTTIESLRLICPEHPRLRHWTWPYNRIVRFYEQRGWILLGLALFLIFSLWEGRRVWEEHSQDEVILSASSRYGVHAALVKAVVWRVAATVQG